MSRKDPALFSSASNHELQWHVEALLSDIESACKSGEVKVLSGGISDAGIFQFEFRGKSYVLRMLEQRTTIKNRRRECHATLLAGESRLGPKVHCYDAGRGYLVADFVKGSIPAVAAFQDPDQRKLLFERMRHMHKIKDNDHDQLQCESHFDRIEDYFHSGLALIPEDQRETVERLIGEVKKALESDVIPYGFCHNDLHVNNMLCTEAGELWFVDWADAGFGSPLCDFASFSGWFCKTDEEALEALDEYLGEAADKLTQKNFLLYRYLTYMLRAAFAFDHLATAKAKDETKAIELPTFDSFYELTQSFFSGEFSISSRAEFELLADISLKNFLDVEHVLAMDISAAPKP